MKRLPMIILTWLVILAFLPCFASGATLEEKAAVEKAIRDSIGWALTKDRPLLESAMVHDERLFIFNPDSTSTSGWDQFVKGFEFWMDSRFKATKLDIRDMRIDLSPSGDAAWWSCILDDLAEWEGKPIGWKDTRWSGVLEKRNGRWRIVQNHFSFAADKVVAAAKARMQTMGADALQTAIDYIEGWYDGDAARLKKCCIRNSCGALPPLPWPERIFSGSRTGPSSWK